MNESCQFAFRQWLDVFSPSNFLLTNPEVLQQSRAEGGQNLVRGFGTWSRIGERLANRRPPAAEAFKVGETLAITPGKVIYRNRLIELIQYAPTTDKVRPEPVLIVPAWIMKYYILDLRRQNSLVRYLVDQGLHRVHDLLEEPGCGRPRSRHGRLSHARRRWRRWTPSAGSFRIARCMRSAIASAARCWRPVRLRSPAMATSGSDRLSFLAAQTDFTEAGELALFINESQVAFLEDMMWEQGYLEAGQMAGAFQLLRSNDLIWSRLVHSYLMGERQAPMPI